MPGFLAVCSGASSGQSLERDSLSESWSFLSFLLSLFSPLWRMFGIHEVDIIEQYQHKFSLASWKRC